LFATVVCLVSCLAVSAFGQTKSALVTVVNPTAQPVPVSDVNTSGFQPLQITLPASPYDHVSYTVPEGKVLVIEDVNASFTLGGPGTVPRVTMFRDGATWLDYCLTQVAMDAGSSYYFFHLQTPTRAYVQPGSTVRVGWTILSMGPPIGGYGVVTGHLINVP
jgi:hypothetical protein